MKLHKHLYTRLHITPTNTTCTLLIFVFNLMYRTGYTLKCVLTILFLKASFARAGQVSNRSGLLVRFHKGQYPVHVSEVFFLFPKMDNTEFP